MIADESSNDAVIIAVRPALRNDELNDLFHTSWSEHEPIDFKPILNRSLAWIAAYREEYLVGFVNVVGDGGIHAIILDAVVRPSERGRGIGRRLMCTAIEESKKRGVRVLHVDYEPGLEHFYTRCGFRTISGGLMRFS
ncbi:MAG: GNAT family N-acetyltransferase [Pseudonocardiaceae bacterium]